jgi:hypothetical protein
VTTFILYYISATFAEPLVGIFFLTKFVFKEKSKRLTNCVIDGMFGLHVFGLHLFGLHVFGLHLFGK